MVDVVVKFDPNRSGYHLRYKVENVPNYYIKTLYLFSPLKSGTSNGISNGNDKDVSKCAMMIQYVIFKDGEQESRCIGVIVTFFGFFHQGAENEVVYCFNQTNSNNNKNAIQTKHPLLFKIYESFIIKILEVYREYIDIKTNQEFELIQQKLKTTGL